MGQNAIIVSFNGQVGVSNFNISCNGNTSGVAGCSATGPLTNFQGIGVSVFMGGTVTGTTTVNNNVIVSNQTIGAGSTGIGVQADDGPAGLATSDPDVNFTVNNNNISNNEGSGIRAIARATNRATMDVTIQNNTVTAPTLANRNGIRVDSGSAAGDTNVCMLMTGNTSAGSGVNAGLGIRKQGTNAAVNVFGIVGLSPSSATAAQAEAKVEADNPSGGGADIISGDNFVSCSQTALYRSDDENKREYFANNGNSNDATLDSGAAIAANLGVVEPLLHTALPDVTFYNRSEDVKITRSQASAIRDQQPQVRSHHDKMLPNVRSQMEGMVGEFKSHVAS